MADDRIRFELDLDAEDAKKTLESFKSTLEKLGASDGIKSLGSQVASLGAQLISATAVIYAFKKAFDLTLQGEEIQRIEKQFDSLSESVGVDSAQMRQGIEGAVKGTVDMTDALQSANKAIIELGPNAKKIPELFDLARKAGRTFGGETTDNFEKLSQAVATGNTRLLKNMGIIIDSEKAIRNYAVANNVAVSALSQYGKQQAILNAVLDQGNKKFKDTGDENESLAISLKQLKVVIQDFGEALAVLFNKTFGPTATGVIKNWTNVLKEGADYLRGQFGDGVDAATNKLNGLKQQLLDLQDAKEKIGERGILGKMFGDSAADIDKQIATIKSNIEAARADLQSKMGGGAKKETPEGAGPSADATNIVELNKARIQQIQYEKELLGLQNTNADLRRQTTTDQVAFEAAAVTQRAALEASYNLQIQQLEADRAAGKLANDEQLAAQEYNIREQLAMKLQQLEENQKQQQLMLYENQLRAAKDTAQGIAAGFSYAGAEANKALNDFGRRGTMAFTAINKGAQGFFKGLGEGSEDAGTLMKKFVLGAIADMAESEGQFLLAAGIGTYNPIQIAEGGALIALAGLLRSQAGGGGNATGGASAGGGGAPSTGPSSPNFGPEAPTASDARKKSVSITVQGSYFETAETQRRLVDLLKQENDATDYKFTNIGVR